MCAWRGLPERAGSVSITQSASLPVGLEPALLGMCRAHSSSSSSAPAPDPGVGRSWEGRDTPRSQASIARGEYQLPFPQQPRQAPAVPDPLCSRSASPVSDAFCQRKGIVPGASGGGAAALGAQNSGAHCPSFKISSESHQRIFPHFCLSLRPWSGEGPF